MFHVISRILGDLDEAGTKYRLRGIGVGFDRVFDVVSHDERELICSSIQNGNVTIINPANLISIEVMKGRNERS